jgi:hypothetical protein
MNFNKNVIWQMSKNKKCTCHDYYYYLFKCMTYLQVLLEYKKIYKKYSTYRIDSIDNKK